MDKKLILIWKSYPILNNCKNNSVSAKHYKNNESEELMTDGVRKGIQVSMSKYSPWAFHGRFIKILHVHGIQFQWGWQLNFYYSDRWNMKKLIIRPAIYVLVFPSDNDYFSILLFSCPKATDPVYLMITVYVFLDQFLVIESILLMKWMNQIIPLQDSFGQAS